MPREASPETQIGQAARWGWTRKPAARQPAQRTPDWLRSREGSQAAGASAPGRCSGVGKTRRRAATRAGIERLTAGVPAQAWGLANTGGFPRGWRARPLDGRRRCSRGIRDTGFRPRTLQPLRRIVQQLGVSGHARGLWRTLHGDSSPDSPSPRLAARTSTHARKASGPGRLPSILRSRHTHPPALRAGFPEGAALRGTFTPPVPGFAALRLRRRSSG